MTDDERIAAAETYVNAITNQDLEAILALYDEDGTVEDPVGSEPKRGMDAIREFYQSSVALGVSAEMLGPVRCAASAVAFPFRVTVPMGNSKTTIDVIDVFEFTEAGKVKSMKAYWGQRTARRFPASSHSPSR